MLVIALLTLASQASPRDFPFDQVGKARWRFEHQRPNASDLLRADEMATAIWFFPLGRADVRYAFGDRVGTGVPTLIKDSMVNGRVRRDWTMVLARGTTPAAGTLNRYLFNHGLRAKGPMTALQRRDLGATSPMACYEIAPMVNMMYYWLAYADRPSSALSWHMATTEEPFDSFLVGIEEMDQIWAR